MKSPNKEKEAHTSQLLHHVLTYLPLRSILKLACTSDRSSLAFVAFQVIRKRFRYAINGKDLKVMLCCYNPCNEHSSPWLRCDYLRNLGDGGLDAGDEGDALPDDDQDDGRSQLKAFSRRYLQFRPRRRSIPVIFSESSGDSEDSEDSIDSMDSAYWSPSIIPAVNAYVNLDAPELFSQLCFKVQSVKLGTQQGPHASLVDVSEKATLRFWRKWLKDHAEELTADRTFVGVNKPRPENILWLNDDKDFGVQVRVCEVARRLGPPVLPHEEEDQPLKFGLNVESTSIQPL